MAGFDPSAEVLDGAKALHTAVTQTFGRAALVQRCQVHKRRNILEQLPERQRPWVRAILTRAYGSDHVKTARRRLQDLARRLDCDHPSAAASVREGLDETLTVLGLELSAYFAEVDHRFRGCGSRISAKWNARRSAATIGQPVTSIGVATGCRYPTRDLV